MPTFHYVFTEDEKGRLGYVGNRYSLAAANDLAADHYGITHVIEAHSLVEAKQKLRGKLVKSKGLDEGYRNVQSR